jgi:alkylation response protein AidB-like acyl-CoA dehydrogenase
MMDFAQSSRAQDFCTRLETFIGRFVLPYNAAWQQSANAGVWPVFVGDLKELAREEGLWNLCLPHLDATEPGTRLSNLEYAPLAEIMGRIPWCAEVFNCNAPDSGNMELLQRTASPAQRERWLAPLLAPARARRGGTARPRRSRLPAGTSRAARRRRWVARGVPRAKPGPGLFSCLHLRGGCGVPPCGVRRGRARWARERSSRCG